MAGLGEEGLAVPAAFGRDLRQQDAAGVAALDGEAVAADGDHLDAADALAGAEDADADVDVVDLVLAERDDPSNGGA